MTQSIPHDVKLDDRGNITTIAAGDREMKPFLPRTYWEIDGKVGEVSRLSRRESRWEFLLETGKLSAHLFLECGDGLAIHAGALEDAQRKPRGKPRRKPPSGKQSTGGDRSASLAFSLTFPDSARFHVPEKYNSCRLIDRRMPFHELYSSELRYNFFLVEVGDCWLLYRLQQTGMDCPKMTLSRQPKLFTLTFQWDPAHGALISLHGSLDEAMEAYGGWLKSEMGMVKLREDPTIPDWVHNVKLTITLDMMRSHWEIAHDYRDVAALAGELKAIGCPADTLFYLPGTNGAYDSMYPDHGPHEELGGSDGFRRMVDSLHDNGFRVMLHANAWGLDPCHPEVEKYLPYLLKDDEGNYEGWQTGGTIWGGLTMPPSYSLKFRTEELPARGADRGEDGGRDFSFRTECVPDECEALVNFITAYRGSGRIRLTANHRSYVSPAGWFGKTGEYPFPFPFLLEEGENEFHVELLDDDGTLADCRYRIRDSFTFVRGCTYPILRADTTNPEWIRIFLGKIIPVVKEYGIDAVHVDATHYHRDAKILEAFKREIPQCAISGEELDSMGDFKMYAFCQNAVLDLLAGIENRRIRKWRYYLPDRREIETDCGWLNDLSPVWKHLQQYIRLYPHLCAPDGFVPVGKVCGIRPPALAPEDPEILWKVLRNADNLGYIPGLRLNYRQYGLDEQSRKAIQELAKR